MRQLLLDLFAPGAASPAPAPRPADDAQKMPSSQVRQGIAAIENEVVAPPLLLPDALAPAQFAHPRASRRIVLLNACVAYELRRGRRRTIGLSVGPDGLSVSAPRHTPLHEIDAVLRQKARWVLDKLAQAQEHSRRQAAARIHWRDGATLPYLGRPITLRLEPRQPQGPAGALLDGYTLHIGLPRQASAEQLRDAAQAWLMRQARRLFTQRLDHFAPQLGVRWQRMSLSSAATRWGSANASGHIRLNWRLVHLSEAVIDYVVVHELAHLREMNHSPRFWQHVQTVLPDYAARRGQLRHETLPPW